MRSSVVKTSNTPWNKLSDLLHSPETRKKWIKFLLLRKLKKMTGNFLSKTLQNFEDENYFEKGKNQQESNPNPNLPPLIMNHFILMINGFTSSLWEDVWIFSPPKFWALYKPWVYFLDWYFRENLLLSYQTIEKWKLCFPYQKMNDHRKA